MKKILYTLFAVSLLAVACTQEVGVSRDHDIDAEVTDMQTKMELTTLYLNLTDNSSLDFDKLAGYVSAKEADVVMFVAPEAGFATWLNQFAADYKVLSVTNDDRRLVMAALVKSGVTINEVYTLQQGATLNNAVLHFKANNIHFVVTQLNSAYNAIPEDWKAQIEAMETNKKQVPLVYTPDNLAERKTELSYIIKQSVDNKAFLKDVNWYFAINTNASSHLDIVKYEKEFYREYCYIAPEDPEFYWGGERRSQAENNRAEADVKEKKETVERREFMPRVYLTENEKKRARWSENLALIERGRGSTEMAKIIGKKRDAYLSRRKNPENLTLKEIDRLCRDAGVDIRDFVGAKLKLRGEYDKKEGERL